MDKIGIVSCGSVIGAVVSILVVKKAREDLDKVEQELTEMKREQGALKLKVVALSTDIHNQNRILSESEKEVNKKCRGYDASIKMLKKLVYANEMNSEKVTAGDIIDEVIYTLKEREGKLVVK